MASLILIIASLLRQLHDQHFQQALTVIKRGFHLPVSLHNQFRCHRIEPCREPDSGRHGLLGRIFTANIAYPHQIAVSLAIIMQGFGDSHSAEIAADGSLDINGIILHLQKLLQQQDRLIVIALTQQVAHLVDDGIQNRLGHSIDI